MRTILNSIILIIALTINVNAMVSEADLTQIETRLNAIEDSIDSDPYNNFVDELLEIEETLEQDKPFHVNTYVKCVDHLSMIYLQNGDFEKADQLLNHAFEIIKENNFENAPCTRFLYAIQGEMWFQVGNNAFARNSLEKAKKMFEQEDDISGYAMCLMDLATVYRASKDMAISYLYLESARELFEKNPSEFSEQSDGVYLLVLINLGEHYSELRQFEKAENLFREVINKSETNELFVRIHSFAVIDLCYLYCMRGNYKEAMSLAYKELGLVDDYRIKENLYQIVIYCECINNNITGLVKRLNEYNNLVVNHTYDLFSNFTNSEIESYWTNQSQVLNRANNFAANKSNNALIIGMAYNNAVYTKSFLLKINSVLPILATTSGNASLINANEELVRQRNKLIDKNTKADSMEFVLSRINYLEKEIITSIPDIRTVVENEIPTFRLIQQSLDKKDVAIEFILLPELSSSDEAKFYYGALILKKDDEYPILIKLCDVDSIDEVFDEKHYLNEVEVNNLYAISNDTIYNLIWKPLEPYIRKGDNIYYSPSGDINKLNIAALSNGKKRLMDIYNIHEVTTTGSIPELKARGKTEYHSALLYGGIDYTESTESMALHSAKTKNAFADFLATRAIGERGNWSNLPATAYEAAQIESVLSDYNVNTIVLSGKTANEESFRYLSGKSPDILHIATHGFFLPEPKKRKSFFFNDINSYTTKGESMFYSGLLFAGANNTWNGINVQPEVEDGILTADEASRVDLNNCKLMVLSACDTGLGTVDEVDGVFGLQRGFKQAGVHSIVMSLWKVSDQATAELMIAFYQSLMKGHNPHKALDTAKRKLIKDKRFSDPYYWAAFVLLE